MTTLVRAALSGALSFTGFVSDQSSSFVAVSVSDAVHENDLLLGNNIEGLVDNLNKGYLHGEPSDDYSEAGIFLHVLDGVCNPLDIGNCNFNLADSKEKFFNGTALKPGNLATALMNEMISSPSSEKYGDEVYVWKSWEALFGPAVGVVYFPCAAKQVSTMCMY